ncbi:AI-2E family transporter [Pararhizobium haloflavum]|uniref:AI-2E family transporter n=1 Tax=Pararhizobium haloflavum TaxID=2037914 RepID=UPI000C19FF95|nr:AI-2E family transporter [Pararhizobium haloflavum]
MATQFNRASLRMQATFWLIALVVSIGFLVLFRDILLPFVAGMALAYFLDPVADRLQRLGVSRLMATILILFAFILVFVLTLMIVIPVLISQAAEFGQRLPEYVAQLQDLITKADGNLLPPWVEEQIAGLRESFTGLISQGAGLVGTLAGQIWTSSMAVINIVALLVITPVVAFYLLLDWDRMVEKVDSWVPRNHVEDVREIARDMDRAIAGFVRGQGTVCIILGLFYAIGLSLVGLNFGLLIGMFAGLISFIPYVGSMIGLILSVGVAVVQFWPDYIWILATAGVFFAGQFLEGNILQPKLVGSSVGLHPVWLMFALFAFASLFGFLGMLIAVPAAAAVGVLVRFALRRYLESDLFAPRAPLTGPTPVEPVQKRKPE